jgi:hypothetical protein
MNVRKALKRLEPVVLVLVALVFAAGLMFASVEIPELVDRLLHNIVHFLDVATGQDALSAYWKIRTTMFEERLLVLLAKPDPRWRFRY